MLNETTHIHMYRPTITFNFGCGCHPKKSKVRFAVLGFAVERKPVRKESAMLNVQLRTNQFALINLAPVDADGKVVVVENLTATVKSGDAVATIVDGKVQVVPSETPGVTVVDVSADGQPGAEVEVITETITLTTLAPNAVSLGAAVEVHQKSELPPPPAE
jgi:hypothetical protein